MTFVEISDDMKVSPGEYILHVPTQQVVLCGAFMRKKNQIKVLGSGKSFVDAISSFKKIQMNPKENSKRSKSKKGGCGCKGKK